MKGATILSKKPLYLSNSMPAGKELFVYGSEYFFEERAKAILDSSKAILQVFSETQFVPRSVLELPFNEMRSYCHDHLRFRGISFIAVEELPTGEVRRLCKRAFSVEALLTDIRKNRENGVVYVFLYDDVFIFTEAHLKKLSDKDAFHSLSKDDPIIIMSTASNQTLMTRGKLYEHKEDIVVSPYNTVEIPLFSGMTTVEIEDKYGEVEIYCFSQFPDEEDCFCEGHELAYYGGPLPDGCRLLAVRMDCDAKIELNTAVYR